MSPSTDPCNSEHDKGNELLQALVGARLTSVQFVLNYLILGFDEKGALTTLVWPELLSPDGEVRYGERGYRDDLCALIEKIVRKVEVSSDQTIAFSFDSKSTMRIPLGTYKEQGERAIFTAPKHVLYVW